MSVFAILISVLLILIAFIYFTLKKRLSYWQSLGIACEEPDFIVGNLKGVFTKVTFASVWLHFYRTFKGTGPFAGFYWFQRPGVFVLDKTLIKNILIKDFANFINRGFYVNEEDDPLTGQLFLLEGHRWKNMRSKLSPTFTSGKMKYMFPTVVKVGHEFIKVFGDFAKSESIIEVKDFLARFTTDVIGTCAFGIDCNSLKDPSAEFRKMGIRALVEQRHGRIGVAFVSSFPKLARKLRFKQTVEEIEQFFMRITRETVELREKNNIRRNDFMDMLIDLKNKKLIKSEDGDELTNLTLKEITAQAFVFFNAGFETSSTTMGFVLYELARNPDIQERCRNEILTVFERHNNDFTYECMKELEYLEQVISETLRLYTIVPILNRECLEDYVVPGHPNFVIKKGMPVLIPGGAIHRDPEYYPNPDVFNPDNFTADLVKERDSVLYLPFGDGPRNCIGLRFGLMQARIGLALLLKDFKFSVCEKTQIPLKYDIRSFLVSSASGIYLKVEKVI